MLRYRRLCSAAEADVIHPWRAAVEQHVEADERTPVEPFRHHRLQRSQLNVVFYDPLQWRGAK
jgi:hypothetical protein